mmetsp:Transcript_12168/g.18804  ORF Transcript_12168/g.18804 Transcript_12168/m.18804 type:complete len:247 (-) Transcript_12168:1207-1947(-)
MDTSVHHVHPDDHGRRLVHLSRRLQLVEIMLGLSIDLSDDVSDYSHFVELRPDGRLQKELARKTHGVQSSLDNCLILISGNQDDDNLEVPSLQVVLDAVSEVASVPQLVLRKAQVFVGRHLNVGGLSTEAHSKGSSSLSEGVNDFIGHIVVPVVIDKGPLLILQAKGVQVLHSSVSEVVEVGSLVAMPQSWLSELLPLHFKGVLLHLQAPLVESRVILELSDQFLNLLQALLGGGDLVGLDVSHRS